MREFQAKKRIRRILYSKWIVSILIIFFILLTKATWGVHQKQVESAANAYQAASQLQKLQDRQNLLTTEINRLSTEAGIEEEIRSKYSVSKPGEHLIVIIDTPTSSPLQATSSESWWTTVWNIFK